jgi:NAD(P)-dependent dehydrogenase (short-subunit alcohol dehydrogenase family)
MPTAIVTGATGILGREIVALLGKDPKWTKIHALSRTQKDEYPPSVQHDHIDLTASADKIAKQLEDQGVEGEYLFFAAYLAKDDENEASNVNGNFPSTAIRQCANHHRCNVEELSRRVENQWCRQETKAGYSDDWCETIWSTSWSSQVPHGRNGPMD